MFLRRTRTLLPTTDDLLAPAMINFGIVKEDILKKRHDGKAYYDKSVDVEHKPIQVGSYACAKPPPRHRGKPWIYGEVIKTDNGGSYTVCTCHGAMIRRNRVQLKPATSPPTFRRPQTALNPATLATTASPTPARNLSQQAEVYPQDKQQTPEQLNTPAEATPAPSLRDQDPIAVSSSSFTETRSGRIIKSPERLKDYVTD